MESDDHQIQMLPIHKINDELVQAVVKHVSELRSFIPETDKSVAKYLEWFEKDFVEVREAIGSLKEKERFLNVQMEDLVRVLNSMRSDYCVESSSSASEHSIKQQRQIKREHSKLLHKTLRKLKESLNLNPRFNLVSYVESKDQMLGIDKIDNELMPAVLNHVSKLKNCVLETRGEKLKDLDEFRNHLFYVRDSIRRLKEIECILNDQMRELVSVDLEDISNEMNAIVEERQKAALIDFMGSEFGEFSYWHYGDDYSEPSNVQFRRLKSGEIYNSVGNRNIANIHPDQIEKELSKLQKTLPKLKETLDFIPKVKVSPSANNDGDDSSSSSKPLESIKVSSSFVESLNSSSLHLTMPPPSHLSDFKEFWILYHSLDVRLKLCLLCFSAFPNNSVINKRVLIYWWIGEGFIKPLDERAKTAENTADEIFQQLRSKHFIEPVYQKGFPVIHRYKMHPFIRFMLVVLAQNVGFFDSNSAKNFPSDVAKSLKACFVRTEEKSKKRTEERSSQHVLLNSSDLKELDILFNVNETHLDLKSHWFSKLRTAKVLQLGRWQSSKKHYIEVENIEFLKSLGNMKQLRYLSLQGVALISELPSSFSNLTNMTVLDLRACHNLQQLPDGIGKLKNLTHLDMSECYLIGHMPQELASLSQLQVLKGFVIGDTKSIQHVCRLTELSRRLTNLRKLSLYISGEPNATKRELFNSLPNFKSLCSLTIAWVGIPLLVAPRLPWRKRLFNIESQSTNQSYAAVAAKATTTAAPTISMDYSLANLEKLDLRCFPWPMLDGPLHPNNSQSLKKLYIRGGELRNLKHIHNPWNIKILRLKYLRKLGMSWEKLQASFPHLSYLEKVGCPNASLFPCDGNGVWMKKSSDSNQV